MVKVTPEEVQEALLYLENFEKGESTESLEKGGDSADMDESQNGGDTSAAIDKEIKKADGEEEEDEEKESLKKEIEDLKKSLVAATQGLKSKVEESEDLKKSLDITLGKTEGLEELVKSQGDQISSIHSLLEKVAGQPLGRKSAPNADVLKKSFGDEDSNIDAGKTVLSKSRQRSTVSNKLFEVFEKSQDERYQKAVAEFEAGGGYISKSITDDLSTNHNIVIVE